MKKLVIFAAVICMSLNLFAQSYQVKQSDYSQVRISFMTPELRVADIKLFDNQYSNITMDNFTSQSSVGMPALPTMSKIIEVVLGDELYYTVESIQMDTLDGATIGLVRAIVPAQASRSKSDTTQPTLAMNQEAYTSNVFLGAPTIELNPIGIARDKNLAVVSFNPVSWNPVTNQLIVVREITVSVKQRNPDEAATRLMQQRYASPAFNSGVEVINTLGNKDNHTNAPLRYTIVAHSSFRGKLDEFIVWKKRKGFMVDIVYTDDANVGSTTSSIQSYLQGLYDNASVSSPAPTYVLFVGDIDQIPAFSLSSYDGPHSSDLSYCCWTGNDYLPDCYYGRFSAQNLSELQPQISKTLMYEQYTFPDDSYLSTAALIAGVDRGQSSDNAYKYGDPAMDYAAKTYVTAANGFSTIVYYKNNTSFAPTGVTVTGSSNTTEAATALRNLYNSGCGFVNYTAHGSETSWGTPSFTTNNVAQMTNNNKPIVMIGNCCLTNSYQISACLGEALLRKGNNAGAVAYIGGSNSTYWTEDFYWSVGLRSVINNTCNPDYDANNLGMYDRLFHSHGESYSNWYTTMGSMIYAGNMAVQSSSSNDLMKEYYWQIYHLMGDPSLMPYYHGQGSIMTANVPAVLSVGSNSMNITAVPYAYIGFTDANHNLVAATFANANGMATLDFSPIMAINTHEVVITAQGYRPYIQNVNIIANGPYVSSYDFTPNGSINADGDISFNITLTNNGVNEAENVSIEFQSVDGDILFDTVGMIYLNTSIAAGSSLNLNNICTGHVFGNVADQAVSSVRVIVRWDNGDERMSSTLYNFNVNADRMKLQSHTFNNNIASQGSATLTVTNSNNGHAALHSGTVTLTSLDPALTVQNPTVQISNINPGSSATTTFNLVATNGEPVDCTLPFIQTINNGFTTVKDTIKITFGEDLDLITFEDNSWGNVTWTQGTYPWELTNTGAYAGTYCARSKTWGSNWGSNSGNNKDSELSITWTSSVDDSITFYKNVSSEDGYDFFRFYIDNTMMEELSGTSNSWSRSAYYVPQGTHTFKFAYEKDASAKNGSDCAWIDNIHLPYVGTPRRYVIDSVCAGSTYTFNSQTISTDALATGNHYFVDTTSNGIYILTLNVVSTPELSISADKSTVWSGQYVRLDASGADRYLWDNGSTFASTYVQPISTTTYTVTGYVGACSATASTTITVDVGIDIAESEIEASVYPNPTHNMLNIECNGMARIVVTDMVGRRIIDQTANGDIYTVDMSNMNNGIYFVTIHDRDGHMTTRKVVKK
ncbi:MAG: T9SS type A sorting domain-containing protein [Bacteroidales bacterium]|nr:T9SS type A sorting domain-containing protein [Bacteroidales bacterium]